MPITPPQVRLPMSGPIFITLKQCEKMSPSEPACSLVSATMGPNAESAGYGIGFSQRGKS